MTKIKLITTEQAAQYLGGFRTNTLEIWRIKGTGPRYRKIGRSVRYAVADLDAYLEDAICDPNKEVTSWHQ